MRLTPDSIVVELLYEYQMRDAIKGLGEGEDHKVHLPSCFHCIAGTSGSITALTIFQNLVMFQMTQDVAGDCMLLELTTEAC